jgi:hypothetical protein
MVARNHVGATAPWPVTPKSDEAGSARNAPAPEKFDQHSDFVYDDASRKALAALRARAALAAPSLRCVGDLLRRIGGAV